MVKKETVALAIIILGFLALMAGPYNNDATNDLSSTEIQKGELSVTEAWWSVNGEKVREVTVGDVVIVHVEITAINGEASGSVILSVKNDLTLALDTEREKQTFSVSLEQGETRVVEGVFTSSGILGSNQKGFFATIEGDTTWTMEDKYPPRLLLKEPESEPELESIDNRPVIQIDVITTCTRIVDGDTFETSNGYVIRLADVDTPERGQAGYQESTDVLRDLIYGKTVYLEVDDVYGTDYEGTGVRYVCVVYLANGLNINQKILVDGYAVRYDFYNEFNPDEWSLENILDLSNTGNFEESTSEPEPEPDPQSQGFVVINEVEANPAGGDDGNEWVELYNPSGYAVDIGGWKVSSTSGQTVSVTISLGTILQPGKYKIVPSSSQWIDNEDEQMILYDSNYREVDRTKVFFDTANDARTIQRYPNGRDTGSSSDWSFKTETKGKAN